MDYCKLYSRVGSDVRIQRATSQDGHASTGWIWVWMLTHLSASDSEDGRLMAGGDPIDAGMIAEITRIPEADVVTALDRFRRWRGADGCAWLESDDDGFLVVAGWASEVESMDWFRKRKSRANAKKRIPRGIEDRHHVTDTSGHVTDTSGHVTPREEEIREREEETATTEATAAAAPVDDPDSDQDSGPLADRYRRAGVTREDVDALWRHRCEVLGRRQIKLPRYRRGAQGDFQALVLARLDDGLTLQDLRDAFSGQAASEWATPRNGGKTHHGWETVLRDVARVESFQADLVRASAKDRFDGLLD